MTPKYLALQNGLHTRYVDSGGEKDVVILTHALSNSLEIWERNYPSLVESFRVIAFDFQGYGYASRPDVDYNGAFFGAQIGLVLDALGIKKAHMVGYSVGATAILHFSKSNMHRIHRAVLAAPGGFGRQVHPLMLPLALPIVGKWLGRPTKLNNLTTLKLAILDKSDITPQLIARTNEHARVAGSAMSYHRALVAGVGLMGARNVEVTSTLAQNFSRPALVAWGQQDAIFPARYAERVVKLIPQSQLLLVDQCGHYLPWEQPDLFAKAVKDFLS